MKNSEQIKETVRKFATERNLQPQEVLQMYLFERILERIQVSEYSSNFILKGGLLISSIIGISERTTMDMDTSVRGIQMEEDEIIAVVKKIIAINVNDGIDFDFSRIEAIREIDSYHNFRVHIWAKFGKMNCPMKIDITTGDAITPDAIRYEYPLLFKDASLSIMAYTLETILAEKFETIIHRNIGTTRARDFYDLYTLYHEYQHEINMSVLRLAIQNTAMKRGSFHELCHWKAILHDIRVEPYLFKLWDKYISKNVYAKNLSFYQVLSTIEEIALFLDL